MEARVSASLAGNGVQSSKAMTISEPRARCTAMEVSASRNTGSPLTGERKDTPASLMRRISPRLKTWNPPESVRMGFCQCMNACNPPWALILSAPGRSIRWKVLATISSAPHSRSSSGVMAFTVA